MEITAFAKSVRISPRKVRLIADLIQNMNAQDATQFLRTTKKRASGPLEKVLKSAISNAKNNMKLAVDTLVVSQIEVMEGPVLKRFHPASRGRAHPYKKRSSHIRIILKERGKN